jgi:hypothetical protein
MVSSKGPRCYFRKEVALLSLEKAVVGVLEKWDIAAKGSLSGASLQRRDAKGPNDFGVSGTGFTRLR